MKWMPNKGYRLVVERMDMAKVLVTDLVFRIEIYRDRDRQ